MAKNIYTIPPDAAFLDEVAAGVWRMAERDIFKLSDCLILLPTRRACRNLHEAYLNFLHKQGINAALLPRMQPLGDVDEDELYFNGNLEMHPDIPPAVTPLRRKLLLTQLITATDRSMPLDQAAQLSDALAQFLDQVQIEGCDLSQLGTLVEENELAEHWQQTVQFLKILSETWPAILANEGCIDPAEHRNRLLLAQAAAWQARPPNHPVIVAGSTGTMPATATLLNTVASLPLGHVILPGLDQQLSETAWQAIRETHPQYGMKQMLDLFHLKRADVHIWNDALATRPARVRLLQESMWPAEVTDEWQSLTSSDIPEQSLLNLGRVELDTPQEEAQAIALMMRAALETPDKTAALVTSDRTLAERVSALLARWGVDANDSAGASLTCQPIGSFLLEVLMAVSPYATSVDYLSLLKHPFAACGLSPAECRTRTRQMEMDLWRMPTPKQSEWFDTFRHILSPMTTLWQHKQPLTDWIRQHVGLAETVAASDTESGAVRLWSSDTGESAAAWLADWQLAAVGFSLLTGKEYTELFAEFLRVQTVRPVYGQNPRITILGPLEARLLQADLVILGGMNETSWPPASAIDPWLSRPMKQKMKLPLPERRIGLSAHDFVQLASAKEVVLTRSRRAGNAPTVPSRFLLQLEAVLHALHYITDTHDGLQAHEPWQQWVYRLDEPCGLPTPCAAPSPRPPRESRPQTLAVTEIGTWRRNPYAIYAKHILKLRTLNPLDAGVDASDRGVMIHATLDAFVKIYPDALPDDALNALLILGRKRFTVSDEHPEVAVFWWPRFQRIAGWFVDHERQRRIEGTNVVRSEAKGAMTLGTFTLYGRADRLDKKADGTWAIVDYKTGGVPSQKQIQAGYEPQLPLLAAIAECGGFEACPGLEVSELAYWQLSGGRDVAREQRVSGDIKDLVANASAGLEALIAAFADPATPYEAVPKPRWQPNFDDYAHLARLAEWGRTGEDE